MTENVLGPGEGASKPAPSRRYGGSMWNAWLDAKLALDLTVAEHKLADALARNMIGYGGKTTEALGNNLLRGESRLDGRSFERAREGLTEKGLIRFATSGRGRGSRTTYVLAIGETTAVERSLPTLEETTAPERSLQAETTAVMTARMTALQRSRTTDTGETKSLPTTNGAIEWLALDADGGIFGRFEDEAQAREFAAYATPSLTVEAAAKTEADF
jgi:hypothetical protein